MKRVEPTPAERISAFLDFVAESRVLYQIAQDGMKEEDQKLQDLLHEMEFARDKSERNRVATKLQHSRRQRRRSKDMAKLYEKTVQFFEEAKNRETLNRLRQLLGRQRTEEKYLYGERSYKPRAGGDGDGHDKGAAGTVPKQPAGDR